MALPLAEYLRRRRVLRMRRRRAMSGSAAFTGPLDGLGISPVFAIAPRRLTVDYTGSLCRLRESDGSTELDIGYDANGDLDTAAAAAHIGANSGFYSRKYTQVGSLNALQSTAAEQPLYLASGLGDKPTADYDGTDDAMSIADLGVTVGGFFCVFQPDAVINASSGADMLLEGDPDDTIQFGAATVSLTDEIVTIAAGSARVAWTHATDSIAADVPHTLAIGWTGSTYFIRVDGDDKTVSESGTPAKIALSACLIGKFSGGGRVLNAKVSEMLIFGDNMTAAHAATLEASAADYYGVTLA